MYEEYSQESPQTARQPLSWQAHEYVHVEKTPDWYWALGLVVIAGAVAALIYNDVLFAIFILVAGFVLALYAARKPNVVNFSITQRGVRIDNKLLPHNAIESFAVDERSHQHTPKLILNPKGFFTPIIVIPLVGVHADDVHDFLAAFLVEEEHAEPVIHHVMEWLGF